MSQITNHTTTMGWMALKAALLQLCVEEIAEAILTGGIDPMSMSEIPSPGKLSDLTMRKKLDGLAALRFFRSPGGERFCWSVGLDPSALILQGKRQAKNGGSVYCRRPAQGDRSAFYNFTGQRFGKLTALRAVRKDGSGCNIWECRCECGRYVERVSYELRHGRATDCGCQKKGRGA